jgi:prepilin-type N-terminal cleavage/methylation domain-containing protein
MVKLSRVRQMKSESGFTMIELLITIAIIGILTAIAIPIYSGFQRSAQIATLTSDVNNSAQGLSVFHRNESRWPTTTEFSNDILVSTSSDNSVVLELAVNGSGNTEACIEGTRIFSASDTVVVSYNMTSREFLEGACEVTAGLTQESPE